MGSHFFQLGQERSAKVQELFRAIAPRYDLINDLQSLGCHRYWKKRLVQLACIQPGERALDLCCGTGDIALALARSGAQTYGLDFSLAMLVRARLRRPPPSAPPVRFICGDAMVLPFHNGQFDLVTIGYGLRNLSDLYAGLNEMWRVVRPGGRLLILDFGKPANRLWRGLYFSYLHWVVPIFGQLFFGNRAAYGYILESLRHYPGQLAVAECLRQMGGQTVRVINFFGAAMAINYAQKPGDQPAHS